MDVIRELVRYSTVPIINAMTDTNHPCEIISDMYSLSKIRVDFTKDKYLYCGNSGNVGLSWKETSEMSDVIGFELAQCCPKRYEMEGIQVFRDIKEAVKGKDIICTDSLPANIRRGFEHYQITKEIMDMTNPDVTGFFSQTTLLFSAYVFSCILLDFVLIFSYFSRTI